VAQDQAAQWQAAVNTLSRGGTKIVSIKTAWAVAHVQLDRKSTIFNSSAWAQQCMCFVFPVMAGMASWRELAQAQLADPECWHPGVFLAVRNARERTPVR
jgi:hypothetical protein